MIKLLTSHHLSYFLEEKGRARKDRDNKNHLFPCLWFLTPSLLQLQNTPDIDIGLRYKSLAF